MTAEEQKATSSRANNHENLEELLGISFSYPEVICRVDAVLWLKESALI